MTGSRAFTLVELLLATVLLSVLMAGILAVLADLGAPAIAAARAQAADEADGIEAIEAWTRLLRDELNSAIAVDVARPGEIALIGYASLDSTGRERTLRPVHVL